MAIFEGKTPADRNKTIAAIVLGCVAVLVLGYLFLGGSSTPPRRTANSNSNSASQGDSRSTNQRRPAVPDELVVNEVPRIIPAEFPVPPEVDAQRNIFGYTDAPKPSSSPVVDAPTPTPSPTPTPPLLLARITPQNVYAGTAEFNLEATGDKFVPEAQIYINESQLPTRFISAQQLAANVPAQMIAGEGARTVVVRTPDGKLYSNSGTLNVQAPPTPNFSYIGLLRTKQYVDTAILIDNGTKTQVSVTRGDIVGGRFRITSISEREITLTDNMLSIKHMIPLSGDTTNRTSPFTVQQQQPQSEPDTDEEGNPE